MQYCNIFIYIWLLSGYALIAKILIRKESSTDCYSIEKRSKTLFLFCENNCTNWQDTHDTHAHALAVILSICLSICLSAIDDIDIKLPQCIMVAYRGYYVMISPKGIQFYYTWKMFLHNISKDDLIIIYYMTRYPDIPECFATNVISISSKSTVFYNAKLNYRRKNRFLWQESLSHYNKGPNVRSLIKKLGINIVTPTTLCIRSLTAL